MTEENDARTDAMSEEKRGELSDFGTTTADGGHIRVLTIIGQVEGHYAPQLRRRVSISIT